MNTPISDESPGQKARALLKLLQQTYPVFRDYSPLVIGIDKQLLARMPEVDRKTLRIALGMHTNSLRYLKTMEKATHRLDLDGNAGDDLAESHRKYAADVVRERFKKDAERRNAARRAEVAAAQERQRTERLSQLVEKFGKIR